VFNLDDIYNKQINWLKLLPDIQPFYAVKANSNKLLIKLLAHMGCNFDCASKGELVCIKEELNIPSNRIIFSNPHKEIADLIYSCKTGVQLITFDSLSELKKIKLYHPKAKLLLRIKTDDSKAFIRLSDKYGAGLKMAYQLIDKVFEMDLNLIGICFHVGSGNKNPSFEKPLRDSRILFDYVFEKFKKQMYLLNIGGGFMGNHTDAFKKVFSDINQSLGQNFPKDYVNAINLRQKKKTINFKS
jgi:ornithine decarboxylase